MFQMISVLYFYTSIFKTGCLFREPVAALFRIQSQSTNSLYLTLLVGKTTMWFPKKFDTNLSCISTEEG